MPRAADSCTARISAAGQTTAPTGSQWTPRGAAYVAGSTTSSNFPVRGALQTKLAGGKNAFVLKLNPAGNALVYSTYLGGNGSDVANGIAIDAAGNAYVALDVTSTNLPATGYQKSSRGATGRVRGETRGRRFRAAV